MSVISSDIKFYLSGGASNADTDSSLGGVISSVEVSSDVLNNLFDKVGGFEAESGDTNYRAIYIKNTNATDSYDDSKTYLSSLPSSPTTTIELSLASETGSPIQVIADEETAPTGQVFSIPTSVLTGLDTGTLAAGESKAIWIKRIVEAGTDPIEDTSTIKIVGDTD